MTRLHHIAVIVPNAEAAVAQARTLGLGEVSWQRLDAAGILVGIVPLGDAELHFIEPLRPDCAPGRILAQRGAATHHLCFAVDDLDAELVRLEAIGYRRSTPEPVAVGRGIAEIFVTRGLDPGFAIQLCGPARNAGAELDDAAVAKVVEGAS